MLAELSGYFPARRDVNLVAGGALQLELTLRPLETPAVTQVPAGALREGVPPPAPPAAGGRTWTYVALGVAVVAAGVGVGFGLSSKSAQDNLLSRVHTQSAAQQLYDTANSRAVTANGFYVGAAVAGAAAVTLFFLEPASGNTP